MQTADVVIVGAGQAGAQAAIALRQGGFTGSIVIVGEEPDHPYERPPLSKAYLAGELAAERLLLRTRDFWAERDVELHLGRRVEHVDPVAHEITTEEGSRIRYRTLIWAAGGHPRRLLVPGGDAAGVHAIRTRGDVDAIRTGFANVDHVVLIGGGYVGLESAAVLAKLGKRITVLETMDRVLARVAGGPVSRFYEAEHRSNGVDIRLNASAVEIVAQNGRVSAVRLASGPPDLKCDMVIVGIGMAPSIGPLLRAGAVASNGVDVDAHCRTSLPDVLAIGDCANHASAFAAGARVRLESVQNAVDQAKVAASYILGTPVPYVATPWFWSNQYDLRLQTVGLNTGYDEMIVRGEPNSRSWSLVYLKQGYVVAIDCINAVRDYVQGKALVEARKRACRVALADPAVPLKALIELRGEGTD